MPTSIVFSCWTRTLELISRHLKHAGIVFERIDGGISSREREKILLKFEKRDDLRVLIMTTGTGAYGLNLTTSNRIFIFEPQWNPAVESQAISRAIRLGQEDSVQVIRYSIANTVEQVRCDIGCFIAETNLSRTCVRNRTGRS
jgi:SNF2 family DNA or RNA helicase